MDDHSTAFRLLDHEARAMLTRLARVKSFALQTPMVVAAALAPSAQMSIDRYLAAGRRKLRGRIQSFLRWLASPAARNSAPAEAQRRFTWLRLSFNAGLADFDTFADVLSQRSEHEVGTWLSGLDAVATDALHIAGGYFEPPPVICYLDQGVGAAIRRARTRLPTGGPNPVGIIRVPRERMVGSGIASSLVHEVGHQADALLDLVQSLRPVLREAGARAGVDAGVWTFWERWIAEIVADLWSVARVGIASTLGLIGVVSLPKAYVFRVTLDDPHPPPWLRVKVSCAIGKVLYPHPQWAQLSRTWELLYPITEIGERHRALLSWLARTIPQLVALLAHHKPPKLRGRSLREVLGVTERQPARLLALFQRYGQDRRAARSAAPSLVFAAIGQAKSSGLLSPEQESRWVAELLTFWALRSTWVSQSPCSCTGQATGRQNQRSVQFSRSAATVFAE